MGSKPQFRPMHLGRKLRQIRVALGLTQSEILRPLGAEQHLTSSRISEYETGTRQPSIGILLAYASVAQIHLEILIDDEASLPDKLPGNFDFNRYKENSPSPSVARKGGDMTGPDL